MAFKAKYWTFSTNLWTFYLERGILQYLENPPGYRPGISIYEDHDQIEKVQRAAVRWVSSDYR